MLLYAGLRPIVVGITSLLVPPHAETEGIRPEIRTWVSKPVTANVFRQSLVLC
jgi:hypothetical protein